MAREKEKMTRVFKMTPDTAMTFFTIVKFMTDHGQKDGPKFRQHVLNWLYQNEMMESVYDTKRSQDQVVSDYRKQGFKVDDRRPKKKPLIRQKVKTAELICQRCLNPIYQETACNISGEGFVCDWCLEGSMFKEEDDE